MQMDLTNLAFCNESFDGFLCLHVLEHIPDDRKAMQELYRILKPGGWGILQVPMSLSLDKTYEDFSITSSSEREKVFGQSDHVRIYALDYLDRLAEAGFETKRFNWQEDKEFDGVNNKYGLLQNESIFIGYKP